MRWGPTGIVTVTVYSILAVTASGKRTSSLLINHESVAALANGFLGEYPIHFDPGGRAEVAAETGVPVPVPMNGCLAVVCSSLDASSTPTQRSAPPGLGLRWAGRR